MPRTIVLVACLLVMASCGGERVEPVGLEVGEEGEAMLLTTCARDVTAQTNESSARVSVEEIDGDAMPGNDCLGGARLDLKMPIGSRELWIEGKRWVRLNDGCPIGQYGPPDVERPPSCSELP